MIDAKTAIPLSPSTREYFLAKRRALLMELGSIEDLLGMERSVETKAEKKRKKDIIKSEVK